MVPASLTLRVVPGATLRKPLLLMQPRFERIPITAIVPGPSLRVTVPSHLLQGAWPVWLTGTSLPAINSDPQRARPRMALVVDDQTLEFNDIDGTGLMATGGRLVYQLPVDLTGCKARLVIAAGTEQMEFTTENGGLTVSGPGRLALRIGADKTAAMTWEKGSYSLDITWSNGDVDRWLHGEVIVSNGGCCDG